MGRSLVDRADALNYYKKCEHKCKKELKALRKQKKMLFIISKKSISCRELKKIKKIRAKASKKCSYSSSDSLSSESDYDSSLSSDIY